MWKFSVSVWVVAYKIKIIPFPFWVINYNYMPHEKKNASAFSGNNFNIVF